MVEPKSTATIRYATTWAEERRGARSRELRTLRLVLAVTALVTVLALR